MSAIISNATRDQEAAAIMAFLRDGWTLYVFPTLMRSYVITDGKPRVNVPFAAAQHLLEQGAVSRRGPHSFTVPPALLAAE